MDHLELSPDGYSLIEYFFLLHPFFLSLVLKFSSNLLLIELEYIPILGNINITRCNKGLSINNVSVEGGRGGQANTNIC